MQDIADDISPHDTGFIQAMSTAMARWGMPLTAARVLSYLLLCPEPVSLDRIAAELGMSKANAWTAARHLEQVGQVQRCGVTGSKRVLFAPADDFETSMLNYSGLLGKVGRLMEQATETAASGAAERLAERSDFYLSMQRTIEAGVADLVGARRGTSIAGLKRKIG